MISTILAIIFGILTLILGVALGISLFYLWRFAKIIMVLEDDFSGAVDALGNVEQTLERILGMRLFFDSKEVQLVVKEALEDIKSNRLVVNGLIQKFVERSKQKYTVVVEEESIQDIENRIREKIKREGNAQDGFENQNAR